MSLCGVLLFGVILGGLVELTSEPIARLGAECLLKAFRRLAATFACEAFGFDTGFASGRDNDSDGRFQAAPPALRVTSISPVASCRSYA